MAFSTFNSKGNPCTRECPDRQPGCNCEKRIAFRQKEKERKDAIQKKKNEQNMIDSVYFGRSRKHATKDSKKVGV